MWWQCSRKSDSSCCFTGDRDEFGKSHNDHISGLTWWPPYSRYSQIIPHVPLSLIPPCTVHQIWLACNPDVSFSYQTVDHLQLRETSMIFCLLLSSNSIFSSEGYMTSWEGFLPSLSLLMYFHLVPLYQSFFFPFCNNSFITVQQLFILNFSCLYLFL